MYGVVLHAHPVRGESHNQRNTTGEVATVLFQNEIYTKCASCMTCSLVYFSLTTELLEKWFAFNEADIILLDANGDSARRFIYQHKNYTL